MKIRFLTLLLASIFGFAGSAIAQQTYYLPQVVNGQFAGGIFRTTFIAFNTTNAVVTVTIVLTKDDGSPLQVTIPGLGTSDRFTLILQAGGTRILQTDGAGDVTAGAAIVTATAAIGISAIFSIFDAQGNFLTEAGVGSSDPLTEFVIPVDSTGTFNTGLALFNFGSGTVTITLILSDTSGREVARITVTLGPRSRSAKFVSGPGEYFPAVTDFRGTLAVSSTGSVVALTLRQNSSPLSFTTLPVVSRSSTRLEFNLPQIANGLFAGGIIRTTFVVSNISRSPATVTLSLTADDGTPLVVTIPGVGTGSTFSIPLQPGGSAFLQTDGAGALLTGAATVTSNVPVGVSAIFTILDSQGRFLTEAGVGDSPLNAAFTLAVDITGQFDTGVAWFNTRAAVVTLTLRLLDVEGRVVSVQTLTIAGRNKVARFVSQLFPGTRNFRGSLSILASSAVAALTIRQNAAPLSFTTLPVSAGASVGRPPQPAALLSRTLRGINVTSNTTVDATLPPGFRLSGTITGPGTSSLVIARGRDATDIFVGATDPASSRYLVVVPAGTYSLLVCHRPAAASAGVSHAFDDPSSVAVVEDVTRDITLPLTAAFAVSGAISGIDTVPSLQSPFVAFSSSDRTFATLSLGADGSYQGQLPNGTYTASLTGGVQFSVTERQFMSIFNLGTLTVSGGGSGTFAVPPTARLSGSVRGPDVATAPFVSLIATDTSAPEITTVGCAFPSSTNTISTFDPAKTYQMLLATGRTHGLQAFLSLTQETAVFGSLTFPVPPRPVAFSGPATQDIDIPLLPVRFTLSGRVTDSGGNGVSGVSVIPTTSEVTGISGASYSGFVQTDSSGNYRLEVLSGTNYQVFFFPPQPQP